MRPGPAGAWWRAGVFYQIYPRSFQDSDGDGSGDLPGIVDRLDYLQWLGIDGIWLNPTFPSPDEDWGYDVSDYTAVHPGLGTMADLDRLVAEAGARGIRVLLDLVPGFNMPFLGAPLEAPRLRSIVEETEALLPAAAWPAWTGSNHDAGRLATRWAHGSTARARCALVMLLTLRGTPFLYYGDEIGLRDVPVEGEAVRDHADHRDHCRTPMRWTRDGGFTDGEPWLPLGEGPNVADQQQDPGSTLHLVRSLIALRRAEPDLRTGAYTTLPAPDGVWMFRRGDGWTVALNLGSGNAQIDLSGRIAIGTNRARDGEELSGTTWLRSAEAVVVFSGQEQRQRLPQNRRRL